MGTSVVKRNKIAVSYPESGDRFGSAVRSCAIRGEDRQILRLADAHTTKSAGVLRADRGTAVLHRVVVPHHQIADIPAMHVRVLRLIQVREEQLDQLRALRGWKRQD